MISIKKFLSADKEAERVLLQAVRVLVSGIGEHASQGDPDVCARFRQGIQEILGGLSGEITPEDLMGHVNAAVSALEGHNRRTARHRNLQLAELQKMVTMLAATLAAVSAASHTMVNRLSEIETMIASASALDDVRTIKAKLSDCLADIRVEAERQRKETGEIIKELSQGLEQAKKSSGGERQAPSVDQVTGLPTRPDAEAALARASRDGTEAFAAVLVLDRLQALNLRFGREVGDEVLSAFSGMIRKHLGNLDQVFRWSGPALVALLPRANSIERIRNEVARMVESKLEHTIETPSRSILLPIAARWTVFPMAAAPRLLYQKIDTFAAIPPPRD